MSSQQGLNLSYPGEMISLQGCFLNTYYEAERNGFIEEMLYKEGQEKDTELT